MVLSGVLSKGVQISNNFTVRIWPILAAGFGVLIALVALSGWLAYVRATNIYAGVSKLHEAEHQTEHALTNLRSDVAVSAVLVRDALLDPKSVGSIREELQRLRTETALSLKQLSETIPQPQAHKLSVLRSEVDSYWRSVDPVFLATTGRHSPVDFAFVQAQILPHRRATLDVISQIEQLNAEAFRQRRTEIDSRNSELAFYVGRMVAVTLLIAVVVAAASIYRMYTLERIAGAQHRRVQAAEVELRKLSRQLVSTQEDERRALSRDLHDQVGQVLTALRISLGNLERCVRPEDGKSVQELDLAKRLLVQALRSTRDLAMGLRPTMLDDLGLEAALEWQARQHAKVIGTPVALELTGSLNQMSDAQSTCVYRIVQEALNNAAKYADAKHIAVKIAAAAGMVSVEISDDGVGFLPATANGHGLGLIGMKERVAQLGGEFAITSAAGQGTVLSASFPLHQEIA